jgi:hypothetical protein
MHTLSENACLPPRLTIYVCTYVICMYTCTPAPFLLQLLWSSTLRASSQCVLCGPLYVVGGAEVACCKICPHARTVGWCIQVQLRHTSTTTMATSLYITT